MDRDLPDPGDVRRVDPTEVHEQMSEGTVHLVCAYADEEKCREIQLEGAESLTDFEAHLERVGRDEPIVFYCA